jgi:phage terminase Nu1 subunit (DNA packaging protein)
MEVNKNKFATQIVGCTERRVTRWIEEGMPTVARSGTKGKEVLIDTTEALTWLFNFHRSKREKAKMGARDLLANEQMLKVALDNAERRGQLLPLDYLRNLLGPAFVEHASQLDGMAGRLANELAGLSDPARIRDVILTESRRIRGAFASGLAGVLQLSSVDGTPGVPALASTQAQRGTVGRRRKSSATRKRRTRSVEE